MGKLRIVLLGAVLLAFAPVQSASAQALTITIGEAHGFTNVVEEDDLLILMRYELPTDDWQTATYMEDATCDDETDLTDRCFTSLQDGAATHVLKNSAGDVVASRPIPRIDVGMSGLYLCADGSTTCDGQIASVVTFGSASVQTCIQGPTSESPRPETCETIQWHSTASVSATPATIQEFMVPMVQQIEDDSPVAANTYVEAGLITMTGSTFPREAFAGIVLIVPDAFQSSITSIFSSYNPTLGDNPITTSITSDAQSGDVYAALENLADEAGTDASVLGPVIILFFALVAFAAVMAKAPGSPQSKAAMASAAGYLVILAGGFLGWVAWAPIFVATVLLVVMGTAWWFRTQIPG